MPKKTRNELVIEISKADQMRADMMKTAYRLEPDVQELVDSLYGSDEKRDVLTLLCGLHMLACIGIDKDETKLRNGVFLDA